MKNKFSSNCIEYLHSYWQGKESREATNRHLYNVCPKLYKEMLVGLLQNSFTKQELQLYRNTIIKKLGRALDFKTSRRIKHTLEQQSNYPLILSYVSFAIVQKTALSVINEHPSWMKLTHPLINAWKKQGLIKKSPFFKENYYQIKLRPLKLHAVYDFLLDDNDLDSVVQSIMLLGLESYIQDISSRIIKQQEVTLYETILVGFIIRTLTRSRKVHKFTSKVHIKNYARKLSKVNQDKIYKLFRFVLKDSIFKEFTITRTDNYFKNRKKNSALHREIRKKKGRVLDRSKRLSNPLI